MVMTAASASAKKARMAMLLATLRTLWRIYRLGKPLFPERTWGDWRNRLLMRIRTLKYLPEVRAWYGISDNPWLAVALRRFPLLPGSMCLPYINRDWTPPQRLAAIDRHYRLLGARTAILAKSIEAAVDLASLGSAYPGLRLVLDKAPWFRREGEVDLNLFVDGHRCYSVVFTLSADHGEMILLVGALQGSGFPSAKALYRELTHALYGMRPRDLLLTALKSLAREFGIRRLWAISTSKHYDKVHADYDAIWREHHGRALDNGFFELPVDVPRRALHDLPSNKRGAYRRRYCMLDCLEAEIAGACALATARLAHSPAGEVDPDLPGIPQAMADAELADGQQAM